MAKFIKGMATGVMVGAAIEMMMMPYWDKSTRRNMRRAGRKMKSVMEDTYDNVHDIIR